MHLDTLGLLLLLLHVQAQQHMILLNSLLLTAAAAACRCPPAPLLATLLSCLPSQVQQAASQVRRGEAELAAVQAVIEAYTAKITSLAEQQQKAALQRSFRPGDLVYVPHMGEALSQLKARVVKVGWVVMLQCHRCLCMRMCLMACCSPCSSVVSHTVSACRSQQLLTARCRSLSALLITLGLLPSSPHHHKTSHRCQGKTYGWSPAASCLRGQAANPPRPCATRPGRLCQRSVSSCLSQ